MLHTYEQHSKRKLVATLLTIVVIAGAVIFADHAKAKTTSAASAQLPAAATSSVVATTDTASTTPPAATTTPVSTTASGYTDGTYSASSNYYVPHSTESIRVSLTLKGGVITGASIQNSEGDNESARYQQDFASVYKSYVVGKKISSLQLGIVAGASDTTQGFDDALSQIATKAQA